MVDYRNRKTQQILRMLQDIFGDVVTEPINMEGGLAHAPTARPRRSTTTNR